MKKLLLASVLLAGACTTLISCDNGDYNTSPETGGVIVGMPGAIQGNFNGSDMKFTPATWQFFSTSDPNAVNRSIYAATYNVSGYYAEVISFSIMNYSGPKGYSYNSGSTDGMVTVSLLDDNNSIVATYSSLAGDGVAQVNITSDVKDIMLGNFSATLYKVYPSLDVNDKLVITNGSIEAQKH